MVINTDTRYIIHSIDGAIPIFGCDLLTYGASTHWSDLFPLPVTDGEGRKVGFVDPATGNVWDRIPLSRPTGRSSQAILLAPILT